MDEDKFISKINHAVIDYEDGMILFEELVETLDTVVATMKKGL